MTLVLWFGVLGIDWASKVYRLIRTGWVIKTGLVVGACWLWVWS